MKAPVNFAQKIKGHKFNFGLGNLSYTLGDSGGDNNKVWIYPEKGTTRNVIRMDFNWEKQYYVVNVVKQGDGSNFHTISSPFPFVQTHHFKSFDDFMFWLCVQLPTLEHHFEYI